jgi:Raf kinase inhibitor-like YbhB/YbcL family protein
MRRNTVLEKLPEFVGHALQGHRAGLENLLFNKIDLGSRTGQLQLSSSVFVDHGPLPLSCTSDGEASSPPLSWNNLPPGTATVALIVEDADSPTATPLVHAIAVGIDPGCGGLAEGELNENRTSQITLGRNSYLKQSWLPPDPPPGHGTHRYAFQVFALAEGAAPSKAPGRREVTELLRNSAMSSGCLIGTYERSGTVAERADTRVRADIPERETSAVPVAQRDAAEVAPIRLPDGSNDAVSPTLAEIPKVGSSDAPGG